jgi:AcrR family transcriptional regulator
MPSVTRKTQSSRARRRDDMVDRLRTAVEALLEAGESYTELSVERLVTEAGISRATFYVYFEDKGDLLRALAEEFIGRLTDAAQHWWALDERATKADLQQAMREIFDAYIPDKVVMAAVVEVASYDAAVREQFGQLVEYTTVGVAKHIAAGQKQGFIDKGLDARRTAAWLTWMAERGLYQLVAPAGKAETERLLPALTDIVWNTLYAPTR